MRDKRPVDELSLEELERIVAIRRREARQERLRRYGDQGRRIAVASPVDTLPEPPAPPPQQHEAAENIPPVEPPVTYDLTDDMPRFEDDPEDEYEERPRKAKRPPAPEPRGPQPTVPRARAAWDRLLLAVEVLAVVGIAGVLLVGGYLIVTENDKIRELEQKSAAIQQEAIALIATPTPAPELRVQLSNYVLPGGHFSPDQTGGQVVFNVDELPASVRPAAMAQLQNAPQAALSTPEPSSASRIVINTEKVQVDASIFGGDDWIAMQKGVGHVAGTANPGDNGNMVLTAHNDVYGEIFRYIELLEPGDEIVIYDQVNRRYTYVVREKQVVKPTDLWVLESRSEPMVTLITCYPYRVDNRRMVVFADLRDSGL